MTSTQHHRQLAKLLQSTAQYHRRFEVFRDFCEAAAISIANAVDRSQAWTEREQQYSRIMARYEKDDAAAFPQMLAHVALALQEERSDVLGAVFMSMDFGDAWKGQFFTPFSVARLMAGITLSNATEVIQQKGFITVHEPAVGAGCAIIACADVLAEQGINFQTSMHVCATDVDITAVHMAYIQFSLLSIPAVLTHGNALDPTDVRSLWFTPAHILGGWTQKLRPPKDANELKEAA